MEALETILEPHADSLNQIANTATLIRLISPIYMLNLVRQKKSSTGFPFLPFTGGLVLTALNLRLASITTNDALYKTSMLGFSLHVAYSFIFYLYTPLEERRSLWKKIILTTLIALTGVVYCEYEDPRNLELHLGLILKAWLMFLVGMPFLGLKRILKNKSVGNMPISIVSSGAFMSFSWMLFGIVVRNKYVSIPNFILFLMGSIQLWLYLVYPPRQESTVDLKEKKKKRN